jgi:hypothetical protein
MWVVQPLDDYRALHDVTAAEPIDGHPPLQAPLSAPAQSRQFAANYGEVPGTDLNQAVPGTECCQMLTMNHSDFIMRS